MTPEFARSKVKHFLLRLWGVDSTVPLAGRGGPADIFARSRTRHIYTRNGVRVTIFPKPFHDDD